VDDGVGHGRPWQVSLRRNRSQAVSNDGRACALTQYVEHRAAISTASQHRLSGGPGTLTPGSHCTERDKLFSFATPVKTSKSCRAPDDNTANATGPEHGPRRPPRADHSPRMASTRSCTRSAPLRESETPIKGHSACMILLRRRRVERRRERNRNGRRRGFGHARPAQRRAAHRHRPHCLEGRRRRQGQGISARLVAL
jgi:hypothetical protein